MPDEASDRISLKDEEVDPQADATTKPETAASDDDAMASSDPPAQDDAGSTDFADSPDSAGGMSPPESAPRKATLGQRIARMFGRGGSQQGELPPGVALVNKDDEIRRDASLQQLRRGFNEAVDTMAAVRVHMEDQARRTERMVELLEGLSSLGSVTRAQTEVLHEINREIRAGRETEGKLTNAVVGLTQSANRQEDALVTIGDRIGNRDDEIRDGMTGLSQAMGEINRTQADTREAYTRDLEQTRQLMEQNRNQTLLMTVICAIMALIALGLGVYVATRPGGLDGQIEPAAQPAPIVEQAAPAPEGDAPAEPGE